MKGEGAMESYVSCVKFPRSAGRDPVIILTCKSMAIRLCKNPISVGINVKDLLLYNPRQVNLFMNPSQLAILLIDDCFPRSYAWLIMKIQTLCKRKSRKSSS